MAANDVDAKEIEGKVQDLSKAMDRMRDAQAERDDVVVELRQSRHTRLELLAKEVQPVFKQVPDDCDLFEFALTNGEKPRLWIDMTSHIRMGGDGRVYELVKDTRMGRTILASSRDLETMAQYVTDYVAGKLVERERLMEGEWVAMKGYDFASQETLETGEEKPVVKRRRWISVFWFVLGALVGAGLLFAWAWFGELPPSIQ